LCWLYQHYCPWWNVVALKSSSRSTTWSYRRQVNLERKEIRLSPHPGTVMQQIESLMRDRREYDHLYEPLLAFFLQPSGCPNRLIPIIKSVIAQTKTRPECELPNSRSAWISSEIEKSNLDTAITPTPWKTNPTMDHGLNGYRVHKASVFHR
jgi:hypothetical protein